MIVTNFSTKEYFKPQERLINSLVGHKTAIYRSYQEIGSPTHQQSPYEFKIWAIEKAWKQDDIVLWCDSSLWLVGDLSIAENHIKEDGYFMTESGHYCGDWVNSFQRDYMKLTDKESERGPNGLTMFSAGLLGLDKKSPIALEFFKQWKQAGKDGAFRGSWKDSRHEMVIGSIIAQRLGMKYHRGGKYLSYIGEGYTPPESGTIFHLAGMA